MGGGDDQPAAARCSVISVPSSASPSRSSEDVGSSSSQSGRGDRRSRAKPGAASLAGGEDADRQVERMAEADAPRAFVEIRVDGHPALLAIDRAPEAQRLAQASAPASAHRRGRDSARRHRPCRRHRYGSFRPTGRIRPARSAEQARFSRAVRAGDARASRLARPGTRGPRRRARPPRSQARSRASIGKRDKDADAASSTFGPV